MAACNTVVVGVVGAGGVGVLPEQQRAGFDLPAMTTTVLALVVVSVLVDACSAAIRDSMRRAGLVGASTPAYGSHDRMAR